MKYQKERNINASDNKFSKIKINLFIKNLFKINYQKKNNKIKKFQNKQ